MREAGYDATLAVVCEGAFRVKMANLLTQHGLLQPVRGNSVLWEITPAGRAWLKENDGKGEK